MTEILTFLDRPDRRGVKRFRHWRQGGGGVAGISQGKNKPSCCVTKQARRDNRTRACRVMEP